MNHAGRGAWRAYSAGSKPTGAPNPFAIETLEAENIDPSGGFAPPRSKSWDEFAGADAPVMDVVVTVCDNAANETCPVWPKRGKEAPQTLHWGFPDPAAATGADAEIAREFEAVFAAIRAKIDTFLRADETAQV